MIGASGLSDDDDVKNEGLNWKLAESVRWWNNIFTTSPLSSFSKFKIRLFDPAMTEESIFDFSGKSEMLITDGLQ